FAAILFTWIFSGLMSMNPFGVFDARGQKPDLAAWRNGDAIAERLPLEATQAITLLQRTGFQPVEIGWRILDGQPYMLTRNAAADTRLIMRDGNGFAVRNQWSGDTLLHAATRLLSAPIRSHRELTRHD